MSGWIVFTSDEEVRGFLQTTKNEFSMKIVKPVFSLFINIPANCKKVKRTSVGIEFIIRLHFKLDLYLSLVTCKKRIHCN